MCLHIVNSVKVEPDKNGNIVCYKVVYKSRRKSSRGTRYPVNKEVHAYKKFVCNRNGVQYRTKVSKQLTDLEKASMTINNGIHVYLLKKEAVDDCYSNHLLIKVSGNIKDLRAVGFNNGITKGAVFTKVKVLT